MTTEQLQQRIREDYQHLPKDAQETMVKYVTNICTRFAISQIERIGLGQQYGADATLAIEEQKQAIIKELS